MISANNVTLRIGKKALFEDVNIKFTEGNCYGLIGANGAGKSTFLKILSGELDSTNGEIVITPGQRLSFLKQDHFQYDEYPVLDTVIMGNARLYEIMKEKEAIYAKEDFTDEDGIRASELEAEFADMDGWEAESDAATLLNGLGIDTDLHYTLMKDLLGAQKVKVLLAQALFGNPDILLLDEPTNHLDLDSREWIESAVDQFEGTLLIVSHDRYFVNRFANRIWELDNGRLRSFDCGYEKYRFIREREDEAAQQEQARQREAEKAERAEKAEKKPARRDGKIERRMNVLERDIAKLEQQLDALDAQMEENASDYVRLGELEEQKNALQAQMDALYEEWEQLDSSLG